MEDETPLIDGVIYKWLPFPWIPLKKLSFRLFPLKLQIVHILSLFALYKLSISPVFEDSEIFSNTFTRGSISSPEAKGTLLNFIASTNSFN